MLKNRDIIFFGEDWGRFPSTTQHIAKELLPQNRIMWIGSLAHRRPTFSLADAKRVIEKVKKVFASPSVPKGFNEKSPIQINPFVIPLHDNTGVRKLNTILLRKKLKKALEDHQFNNPIIITSSPLIGDILGELGETSSHYLCLDDYSHFKGAFRSILQMEQKMLKKISASFSVSDFLVESRKPANGRSYFLPQGVQANHFVKQEDKIPNDMKALKRPVIGFFGLVSEWIDLDLIVYAAKKLPNFTFLVIGKPSVNVSVFKEAANINFVGEVSFQKLPLYASVFDVGIISFKVNELTIACNPLKLLEYLSLGIPVVSVDLPEVRKFSSDILIAKNYDDFVAKISEAVQDISEEKNKKRRKTAEKYSWNSIAEFVSDKIMEFENSK